MAGSVVIFLIVSLIVSTYPSLGYRAGYDAAVTKGWQWISDAVDRAAGTALDACDQLHRSTGVPAPEYDQFVSGCSAAIDDLHGGHIPVLSAGR